MANPQKENGYVPIANELAEALGTTQLSGYQSRCLWFLLRKTYGWNKKSDVISLSQWVEGTGLRKSHVCRTLNELVKREIVTKNGNKWALNKDYSQWRALPKMVMAKIVTKNGNKSLPKMGHTKDTSTKEINTSSSKIEEDGNGSIYHTKKGKELSGDTLQTFYRFWDTFNHKLGKAEAADAWLEIQGLDNGLLEKIITAAKKEAERRPSLIAKNKTPKMAQGWLSGRRWEDEIPDPPQRTVAL